MGGTFVINALPGVTSPPYPPQIENVVTTIRRFSYNYVLLQASKLATYRLNDGWRGGGIWQTAPPTKDLLWPIPSQQQLANSKQFLNRIQKPSSACIITEWKFKNITDHKMPPLKKRQLRNQYLLAKAPKTPRREGLQQRTYPPHPKEQFRPFSISPEQFLYQGGISSRVVMFQKGRFATQETPRPRGRATAFGSCGHPRHPILSYMKNWNEDRTDCSREVSKYFSLENILVVLGSTTTRQG